MKQIFYFLLLIAQLQTLPETLKDRIWLWGDAPDADFEQFGFSYPASKAVPCGGNCIYEPEAAANYLGIRNIAMHAFSSKVQPSVLADGTGFKQYYAKHQFSQFDRIMWSLTGANVTGASIYTSPEMQTNAFVSVRDDSKVTGFFMDDFSASTSTHNRPISPGGWPCSRGAQSRNCPLARIEISRWGCTIMTSTHRSRIGIGTTFRTFGRWIA
jgi:hypothetical protein